MPNFPVSRSPCAIIIINTKGTYLYLLMGFNVYLGSLVQANGATSISTISLVDVDVWSFSSYIYMYQPLGQSTSKLPYGEPLVWEITRVVNHIFLILLSPSPLSSCCPARRCAAAIRPATQPNWLRVLLPGCLLVQRADHVQFSSSSAYGSRAAAVSSGLEDMRSFVQGKGD